MIVSWITTSHFTIIGVRSTNPVLVDEKRHQIVSMDKSEASTSMACSTVKSKSPKLCGVCGDRAKSYHFGGISCDSCKAFFRRSVQNDAHRNFNCPYDNKCEISISSRKCCQHCRFVKCISIGMEKSWVMTEDERLQLLRQRMERKSKQETSSSSSSTSDLGPVGHLEHRRVSTTPEFTFLKDRSYYLSETEVSIIEDILSKYHNSLEQVPYAEELHATDNDRPILDIISMLTTTIKRMTHFAGSLETFANLPKTDQASLLRCSMIEVCIIRAAYAYDQKRECWPNVDLIEFRHSPHLRVSDLRKLVSPELHQMHMKFNQDLRQIARFDETTYMLLLLVVLFSSDRRSSGAPLENSKLISNAQDLYLALLRQHMNWYFSEEYAAKLYPKLLLKLPDLRQVNDAHTHSHLQLTDNDIVSIQRQFGNILHGYRIESSNQLVVDETEVQVCDQESSHPPSSTTLVSSSTSPSLSSLLTDTELEQFHLFYPSGDEVVESGLTLVPSPNGKRKKPP